MESNPPLMASLSHYLLLRPWIEQVAPVAKLVSILLFAVANRYCGPILYERLHPRQIRFIHPSGCCGMRRNISNGGLVAAEGEGRKFPKLVQLLPLNAPIEFAARRAPFREVGRGGGRCSCHCRGRGLATNWRRAITEALAPFGKGGNPRIHDGLSHRMIESER